jgi:acid phosphatase
METPHSLNRRRWFQVAFAASALAIPPLLGIRPRFRRRFAVAGRSKLVANDSHAHGTAPRTFRHSAAIRCLVLGDWGSGTAQQRTVAAAMAAFAMREQPEFIISTGDNFYPSGVESLDDPKWTSVFENVYSAPALQLPWYVALGNHDHAGAIDPQLEYHAINPRWNLPRPWFTFSRTAGEVTADFFVLDTEVFVTGKSSTRRRQLMWLDEVLSASRADWKICIGHHPVRSFGYYGATSALIDQVQPLLRRRGVHAYLCGHDHDLQLVESPDDRFPCIVSGAGGKSRDTAYGTDSLFASTNGGFAYLALTRNEMYISFVDAAGATQFAKSWDSPANAA